MISRGRHPAPADVQDETSRAVKGDAKRRIRDGPAAVSKRYEELKRPLAIALWLPAFFTSFWLWLYVASGFLLKAARLFDIGFQWFNSTFDIDKRPLQSMGVVAGVLVMLLWWGISFGGTMVRWLRAII